MEKLAQKHSLLGESVELMASTHLILEGSLGLDFWISMQWMILNLFLRYVVLVKLQTLILLLTTMFLFCCWSLSKMLLYSLNVRFIKFIDEF